MLEAYRLQLRSTQATKATSFQRISLKVPYGVITLSERVYPDDNEMKRKSSLGFGPSLHSFCQHYFTERGRISSSKGMEVKDSKGSNALVEN